MVITQLSILDDINKYQQLKVLLELYKNLVRCNDYFIDVAPIKIVSLINWFLANNNNLRNEIYLLTPLIFVDGVSIDERLILLDLVLNMIQHEITSLQNFHNWFPNCVF